MEEYFGIQRELGRRNDNSDMEKFCYNDNTRNARKNMLEKYNKINSRIEASDETVPKPKIR